MWYSESAAAQQQSSAVMASSVVSQAQVTQTTTSVAARASARSSMELIEQIVNTPLSAASARQPALSTTLAELDATDTLGMIANFVLLTCHIIISISLSSLRHHYLVAMATSLDKLKNNVQIRHRHVKHFYVVKSLRKSVQYIRRYVTKYAELRREHNTISIC